VFVLAADKERYDVYKHTHSLHYNADERLQHSQLSIIED